MQTADATIRPATFDEAEAFGFDGTLRTHGRVYIVDVQDGPTLACASVRTKVIG